MYGILTNLIALSSSFDLYIIIIFTEIIGLILFFLYYIVVSKKIC